MKQIEYYLVPYSINFVLFFLYKRYKYFKCLTNGLFKLSVVRQKTLIITTIFNNFNFYVVNLCQSVNM